MRASLETILLALALSLMQARAIGQEADWQPLFDGRTLWGWNSSNAERFQVRDGEIVIRGPAPYLYYVGDIEHHEFSDFELQLQMRTEKGTKGALYFHTSWTWEAPPASGYAIRINNSDAGAARTGSLEGIQDDFVPLATDGKWFTLTLRVNGKRIQTRVNDHPVASFTEPDDWQPPRSFPKRRLLDGTIALPGLNMAGEIRIRSIKVRPLRAPAVLTQAAR